MGEREVEELRRRLEELSRRVPGDEAQLLRALRARGLQLHRRDPKEEILLPAEAPEEASSAFYEQMKRYSFRLFLRDMISKGEAFVPEDLTRYCSLQVVKRYLRFLEEIEVIKKEGETYHLLKPSIHSFGPTLEWFIAEVFKRELGSFACYGVRFRGRPPGGDYDVIALWEGNLIYVEIKSSPPRGIEQGEIRTFFKRLKTLLPACALLLNDTHLRMKDKIVQMFEEEIAHPTPSLQRLSGELFHLRHRIYILNSKKDLVKNLITCLRDFLLFQTIPSELLP